MIKILGVARQQAYEFIERRFLHGLRGGEGMTLGIFIADAYTTWVNASHPRTAANTLDQLTLAAFRRKRRSVR